MEINFDKVIFIYSNISINLFGKCGANVEMWKCGNELKCLRFEFQ